MNDDHIDEDVEESQRVYITYHVYGQMMTSLVSILKESNLEYDYIAGIRRGGLPIAVHLSHFLGIKYAPVSYIKELTTRCNIMLVDDIVDTGKVMTEVLSHMSHLNVTTVTLFYKPHSPIKPDVFIEETIDWIEFPWEKQGETPNRRRYMHL